MRLGESRAAASAGAVFRGVDADADRIGTFLHAVLAVIDGRPASGRLAPAPRTGRSPAKG